MANSLRDPTGTITRHQKVQAQRVLSKPAVLESFLLDHTRLDCPDFAGADVALFRDN